MLEEYTAGGGPHVHPQSDIVNLESDLVGKAPTSHAHVQSEVTGLITSLAGKADTAHLHSQAEVTNLVTDLAGKSDTSHNHNVTSLTGYPGGTSDFLRADGAFAAPAGGPGGDPFTFKGSLANDISTGANTTPIDVTGLVFTYEANAVYIIEVYGSSRAAVTTTGIGLQLNLSSVVTRVNLTFTHQLANTGTRTGGQSIADDASVGVSSGRPTINVDTPFMAGGILKTAGNTGTAQLRFRSEVAAVATLMAGTSMRVHKI